MKSKKTYFFIFAYFLYFGFSTGIQSQVTETKADIRAREKAQAAVDVLSDNGFTGPVHTKNIGKILFDVEEITPKRMNDLSVVFKNQFNLSEPVYACGYFQKGIKKYLLGNAGINGDEYSDKSILTIKVEIDGIQIIERDNIFAGYNVNYKETTFDDIIFPKNKISFLSKETQAVLNNLSAGSHLVKVEFYGGFYTDPLNCTKVPIAAGEFTLVKKEGEKLITGNSFNNIVAGMSDPVIEQKMVDAVKNRGWKEVPEKAVIESKEWVIVREYGSIVRRALSGTVYSKFPEGNCQYQNFNFVEDYDGTKYSGNLRIQSIGSSKDCDCLEN